MTAPDYDDTWADDDWPGREEPDCFGCCDSGRARPRWWSTAPNRPCPDCAGGDWWDRLAWRLAGPRRVLRDRRRARAGGPFDDEPPF